MPRATWSLPFNGSERQAAALGRDRALRVARSRIVTSASRPKWSTARWCASASMAFRRSWCSTACPGIRTRRGCCRRCTARLAALLLTAVFWPITAIVRRRFGATLGARIPRRCAPIASARSARSCCSRRLGCGRVHDHPHVRVTSTTSATSSTAACVSPKLFGMLAFLVGSALILWNLRTVWTGHASLAGENLEHRAGARRRFIVLWIAFVFNLFSFGVYY